MFSILSLSLFISQPYIPPGSRSIALAATSFYGLFRYSIVGKMESFHTRQATQFASEKDNAERLKVVRVDLKRTQDGFRTGVLHPSINKKAVDFHTPLAGSSYGYCGNFHQFNEQVLNEICSSLTLFANDDFVSGSERSCVENVDKYTLGT